MKPPLLSIMVHPMKSTVLSHPRNATPRLVLLNSGNRRQYVEGEDSSRPALGLRFNSGRIDACIV